VRGGRGGVGTGVPHHTLTTLYFGGMSYQGYKRMASDRGSKIFRLRGRR